jgi:hypothetical protein
MRVLKLRDDVHLALEAVERFGVAGKVGREDLNRHGAPDGALLGAVNGAHAALAQLVFNSVLPDVLPGRQCHVKCVRSC